MHRSRVWSISLVLKDLRFSSHFHATSFLVLRHQSSRVSCRKLVGKTIDSKFSFAAVFPVPCVSLAISPHKIRCCSEDTELIDGNNCSKNRFNGVITNVEVNGFHSFHFAFSILLESAGCTEYKMSAFRKVDHQILSNFVPLSVPFLLQSTPQK